jgi:peptidoglycan/LPS O-acetylase OafA/YrhL
MLVEPTADVRSRDGLLDRSTAYIPTLDGWRAVAIAAVIFSHAKESLFGSGGIYENSDWLHIAAFGRLGVDLFFAISGFLITSRLLDEIRRDGRFSLRRFYIRRGFRILPPYLTYLAFISLAGVLGLLSVSIREVVDCLLFVRNYTMHLEGTYTNHFWSLAVEEHFYLLWPLLLLASGPRRAIWMIPVLGIALHLWRSLDTRFHLFAAVLPDSGPLFRTDLRIDALFWGCFAALVLPAIGQRRRPWIGWALLPILAAIVWISAADVPMRPLWYALLFPLLVVSTVLSPQSPAGRILELAPLRWIGRMSYSLYLWQTLFLQTPEPPDVFFHLTWLRTLPWNLLGVFVAALLSFYLVERPMVRLGHRLTARPRRPRLEVVGSVADAEPVRPEISRSEAGA